MASALLTALVIIVCLALSFMLSGMEAGVFALSRLRVRQQVRAGRASARLLHGFLENPENFLWTILVGNTLVNFVVLGWVIVSLHGWFGGRWVVFAILFAVLVFLFYALFDLLPKMLFHNFPNRLCLLAARPFRFVHLALRPLVALVEWHTARRPRSAKFMFQTLRALPQGNFFLIPGPLPVDKKAQHGSSEHQKEDEDQ